MTKYASSQKEVTLYRIEAGDDFAILVIPNYFEQSSFKEQLEKRLRHFYKGVTIQSRETSFREVLGRKVVNGKEYTYKYYTLPLNIYIPKAVVEKHGKDFILEQYTSSGVILSYPKSLENNSKLVGELKRIAKTLENAVTSYQHN